MTSSQAMTCFPGHARARHPFAALLVLTVAQGITGCAVESSPDLDSDGDSVNDEQDNCPTAANPAQNDEDADGIGDACDACPDLHSGETPIWQKQNATLQHFFQPFFTDTRTGWISGTGGSILHTTDGGGLWTAQSSGVSGLIENIAFAGEAMNGFAVGGKANGSDGFVLQTTDGGATWIERQTLPLYDLHGLHVVTADEVWTDGHANMILHTTDGGATWESQVVNAGASGMHHDIGFGSTTVGYALGHMSLKRTTDGGESWDGVSGWGGGTEFWDMAVPDPNHVWLVGDGGRIVATTDGGETWSEQDAATSDRLNGVFFLDNQRGWVVGDGGHIARTTDGGITWTVEDAGSGATLLGVHAVDPDGAWVVGASGTIYRYCAE